MDLVCGSGSFGVRRDLTVRTQWLSAKRQRLCADPRAQPESVGLRHQAEIPFIAFFLKSAGHIVGARKSDHICAFDRVNSTVSAQRRAISSSPVIFVTAYPQMLLRGEGTEPAFLVTKPFEEAALKAMINQVLLFHNPADRARGPALA